MTENALAYCAGTRGRRPLTHPQVLWMDRYHTTQNSGEAAVLWERLDSPLKQKQFVTLWDQVTWLWCFRDHAFGGLR